MTVLIWLSGAFLLPATYLLYLFTYPHRQSPDVQADERSTSKYGSPLASVLAPAYTTHARILPIPTKHAFSYPLIYLAVDIDELESGHLDLPGRLVNYGGSQFTKVLGLRPVNYLTPGPGTLREKVNKLLLDNGVGEADIGRVWLVTMPSFLGFEGINPLSVWYIYAKGDEKERGAGAGKLSCIILEVHNTFGEKHAYILRTNNDQYAEPPNTGYNHAWVFPRTFHVSPFNSRNGYYRLDIVDPFPQRSPPASKGAVSQPEIKVFLRLLTPEKTTKLTALLASHPTHQAIPLDANNISALVKAVLRWPMALFASTPRILYQAYKLHYEKKLAMFPRPEPRAKGQEGVYNPPQNFSDGMGFALGWQGAGWAESASKRLVGDWVTAQARNTGYGFKVLNRVGRVELAVPASNEKPAAESEVVLETSDPSVFTRLVTAPSPDHFLIIAKETLTLINDVDRFRRLFNAGPTVQTQQVTMKTRIRSMAQYARHRLFLFDISFGSIIPPPHITNPPPCHWTDHLTFWQLLLTTLIIKWTQFGAWAEEGVMYMIKARFVPGSEPWKVWDRALIKHYAMEDEAIEADSSDTEEPWEVVGSMTY